MLLLRGPAREGGGGSDADDEEDDARSAASADDAGADAADPPAPKRRRVRVRVSSLFAQNLRAWTALRQPLKQAFQPGTALSSFPSLLPFLCIVLPVYLALMLCQ